MRSSRRSCARSRTISSWSACSRGRWCLSPTAPARARTLEFTRLSSYGLAKESSGAVQLLGDIPPAAPAARCCSSTTSSITSRSIAYASAQLRHRGVGDLWTCALLDKRQRREVEVALHFVGFSVADLFVVGLRHRLRREVSPSALYRRRRVNGARSIIAPGPRKKGKQP